MRGTFTHNNLDFCEDVLHFADAGFDQVSVEPVVGPDTEAYSLKQEDLPTILEQYDKLAAEMVKREKEGRGFTFFHFMIDLTGGPCVYKRLSGCGSGTEYLAVTPWGDFYPCHQFVGQEKYLMGNVDEGIRRQDIVDEFKCCNVYTKEKCRNCFAKFYCSGGCAANSYNFHGTIQDAYDLGCELQRKRVECAIMIKAALADKKTDLHIRRGFPGCDKYYAATDGRMLPEAAVKKEKCHEQEKGKNQSCRTGAGYRFICIYGNHRYRQDG